MRISIDHVKLDQHLLIQTLMNLFIIHLMSGFDNGVESHKTIDGLYTRVCVSDKVKNVKI